MFCVEVCSCRLHTVAIIALLVSVDGLTRGQVRAAQTIGDRPRIISPVDDARVACPGDGPCFQVTVEGRVSRGYWPFIAVAPIRASPRIWIQPPIMSLREDGTFQGLAYLGTAQIGAGEQFQLLIFAHADRERFREGQILERIPDGILMSDAVTVFRPRQPAFASSPRRFSPKVAGDK